MEDNREKALVLLRGIRTALASGTEHFNRSGKKLETVEEVLQCLLDEGGVFLKPPGMIAEEPDA
jgi:hypothetical protein